QEGMASWEPLDKVLQKSGLGVPDSVKPPPIPATARKAGANRNVPWGVVVGLSLGVIAFIGFGIMGVVVARQVSQTVKAGKVGQTVTGAKQTQYTGDGAGAEAAGRPIILSTNTLSQADVHKRGRAFRERQYLEAYRKHGPHSEPWDAEALQLIESWIAHNYGGGATNLPSSFELADKLASKSGCEDPLILTVASAVAIELHEKTRRLERAVAGFEKSPYPAYPKLFAIVSLASELHRQDARDPKLDERAVRYLEQALSDGSLQPGDEEEIAEILLGGWATGFFRHNAPVVRAVIEKAKGFTWLALVLDGEHYKTAAWEARGSGWANSVSDEGWKGFSDNLAKARTALTKAWKLHPNRVLAPALMISVAMGDSDEEEMRLWFDRSVQAQMDYSHAWNSLRWGLRPRWHGSHEALLALGARAIDTKRFDTDVPRNFFMSVKSIENDLELAPGEHIYGREDVWPHMQRMYEGYIAEPSQAQSQSGWRSTYSVIAYLAGKYEISRQQLEAIDWKPEGNSLTAYDKELSLMPLEVAARTGKAASQVTRAEAAYDQGNATQAIKIYSELGASAEIDEKTQEFARCRLAALKQEELLAKGEWIDFMPSGTNDVNWVIHGSKFRRLEDGALEVEADKYGHSFYSRTRVGHNFEVTGEFELVRSSTQDFQAGLIMGLPNNFDNIWYAFRMKQNADEGQVASFSRGWGTVQIRRPAKISANRNSFRFQIQHGKADAWVNDAQVLKQASPEKRMVLQDNCLLGLGAYNDMNDTVIRYRNIKVRRLGSSD
ncbi:MAG TPA: DUF4034 domain-containing protein, partial [Clostridia bacterium]|nr:DUF4034 domain-containing protein [Clostridia bacterium]